MKLAIVTVLTVAVAFVLRATRRRPRVSAARLAQIEAAVQESRECLDRSLSAGLERMSA